MVLKMKEMGGETTNVGSFWRMRKSPGLQAGRKQTTILQQNVLKLAPNMNEQGNILLDLPPLKNAALWAS